MSRLFIAAFAAALLLAAGHTSFPAHAASQVYADPAGSCADSIPCYTTIQKAVNNASPGAQAYVFPGTYAESVNLNLMGSEIAGAPGAITITTVNSSGDPEPRTASVTPPASGPAIHAADFPANITINGLAVTSPDDSGIAISSTAAVTLRNVLAGAADGHGLEIVGGGIDIRESTAEGNEGDGFHIGSAGNVELQRLTVSNNGGSGIVIMPPPGGEGRIPAGGPQVLSFNVAHSMIMDNDAEGVLIAGTRYAMDGNFRLRENVICGNGDGVRSEVERNIDAIATWWGAFSGPSHPDNPGGTGDSVLDSAGDGAGIIDYDPFIHHIDILAAFGDVVISFLAGTEGTPPRINQGPGDPNADEPPFEIHVDPGTVTTSGMIVNGNLTGTLEGVDGEVDVSVTGPCGLSGPAGLLWGDLDCDGNLAIGDALKTARYLLGLSVSQQPGCPLPGADVNADGTDRIWGDIDCDGGIAIGDALKIARRLLGLSVSQAEGCPLLGTPVQVQ